ncbi:glucans biosynthesis glucosyltransferase MdoH [Aidingimonas lacisalsi]|uniref:glucans biosynthesis glucosyltransferase MdoH n=1 Tax=Aidingimonas lacisalsi TaxID=2604086 RepID=UPI0011D1C7BB|nr:glucans biosynthesis glucosyltransferase MdoH [Aidingimonas lacisalsi]
MSGIPMNRTDSATHPRARIPWQAARRGLFVTLVIASTVLGGWTMFHVLHANGFTPLQWGILGLFVITFGWIVTAFWNAVIGFILQCTRREPLTLRRLDAPITDMAPLTLRTALVMPIYHEAPERVVAGLEATCQDLLAQGEEARWFEVFVLSDSQDPDTLHTEQQAIAGLQQRLAGQLQVHYRQRHDNHGRKAGNLAEFCQRWGYRYDALIVLDADSIMGGNTLISLAHSLQANPDAGLIQTVPIPARQRTAFGRFTQFAAALYSPMLATGQSFWQGDAANYWGHNAILRTEAFMAHCGLPRLPGRPPLGGDILSHDFVEAALLRRAGWHVLLDTRLDASYEEVPANLIDFAKRDRRWTQGNLQHLRLLPHTGWHIMNRLHFLFGALAYVSSLLWMLMLAVSSGEALLQSVNEHDFFHSGAQLFPNWPESTPWVVVPLLAITLSLLLLPKLLGVTLALWQRPAAFGGRARLLISALLEMGFAALIAPIMMIWHSRFVACILAGRHVDWGSQVRDSGHVAWHEALRHTWTATLLGGAWAMATQWWTPAFFWWLAPVWIGLVLATPLTYLSGHVGVGASLERWGLLRVPTETQPAPVLQRLTEPLDATDTAMLTPPPPEQPRDMPTQVWGRDGSPHRNRRTANDVPASMSRHDPAHLRH